MGSTDVSILLGNGSGGFSPASGSPVTVGDYPFGVAVGDFNGDGGGDLAVANWGSDDVSILPGTGTGGFSAPGSPVAVGTRPYYVTAADFFKGTTLLGTATIAGSTASLTTSALPVGTTAITAVYSGDMNLMTSTSTLSQVTSAADFTLA